MYYGKQTDAGGWYIVSVDEVNPITEKPEVGSKMKYLGTTEKGEVTEDVAQDILYRSRHFDCHRGHCRDIHLRLVACQAHRTSG